MIYGAEEVFKSLRTVILAKPDYFNVTTAVYAQQQSWINNVDLEKAQYQHQQLAERLQLLGVTVHSLDSLPGKVDQVFVRDVGVISSRGAILSSFSAAWRRGEENALATFCERYDIPILNERGRSSFEGGDFFFLEKGEAIIGKGPRTNGAREELGNLLGIQNMYPIDHQSPHHLDAVFNLVREDLVVAHKDYLDLKAPYFCGKRIIELDEGDVETLAANYLILGRDLILADKEGAKLNQRLRKEGVTVVEVDVSELKKGGGSVRCMTLPLWQK